MENTPTKFGRGMVLVTFADGTTQTFPVHEFTLSVARPVQDFEIHLDDLALLDWDHIPPGTAHVHADGAAPIKPQPVAVPDLQSVVLYGAPRIGKTNLRHQMAYIANAMAGTMAEKAAPPEPLPATHGPRTRGKAQWKRERFTR